MGRWGLADLACHDSNQIPAHSLTHWASLCSASQIIELSVHWGGGKGGGDELPESTSLEF